MGELKILDITTALESLDNDVEIYEVVAETYLSTAKSVLAQIRQGYETKDVEIISRNAHSLKSSSRSIGGIKLGEVAFKLEEAASEIFNQDLLTLIEDVESEYKHLIDALKENGYSE